ncbi:hypothetical protein HGM15179_017553 [Zosterops borbonicus]|uniref:Integrase catalytic domain-containing protein n=1 Tax=Zosterops borbonicus TaxID=364589 RepID=A0A8K1G0L1_9PASS|nr:hypothetical protein HGM15179_017553 [Zosterops borbonicus]
MFEHLLQGNASLQLSLDSYRGQISVHAPSHKLFNEEFHLIPCEKRSQRPLKTLTVYMDTSEASHKLVMTWRNPQTQHWEADVEFVEGSPQVAELAAVVRAFEKFLEPINLVTDSAYVEGVVSRAEQAVLKEIENEHLFRRKVWHAKQHLVQAFSVLGIPKEIKTDNGPAYVSKEFLEFVQQWGVERKAGIPHSPTEKTYLSLNPVMNSIQIVTLLMLNGLATAWIIPQLCQNVWVTLAQTLQQENICLSTAAAKNPMSTCLVGIPSQAGEFPADLETHRSNEIPESHTPQPHKDHHQQAVVIVNPLEE